jgi:hypothetical protein
MGIIRIPSELRANHFASLTPSLDTAIPRHPFALPNMKPMTSLHVRCLLLVLLLGLAASCGDEPQRLGKSEPAPANPHAEMPANPHAEMSSATVRLAGRVQLAGTLAKAQSGAVFMMARSGGKIALVHKYDMSGPAWSTQGDQRVLNFSLTDQDNMGGIGAAVGAKMDLEARYDPDGFVDTKPNVEKKGVVKAFTNVAIGDTQVSMTLDPAVATPLQAPPTGDPHVIAPKDPHSNLPKDPVANPPANPHGKPSGG